MEKTKFCKESIKELATVLGLKVDNVTTIELLNKIKKIFLLEENLDNKVVFKPMKKNLQKGCFQ